MDRLELDPKVTIMRNHKVKREDVANCVDLDHQNGYLEEAKKKKGVVVGGKNKGSATVGGCSNSMRCCQVENCNVDLHGAKQYHRRHKVCEYHAKAQVVLVGGIRQRFCQQCSRFHELAEFDDTKRSCRRRLAGHNERRRKNSDQSQAEGSNRKGTCPHLKDIGCGDTGRIQITIQENDAYKHFRMR